jgi:mannose-6-phosphate isomerase-like protein (cupin superfamily)
MDAAVEFELLGFGVTLLPGPADTAFSVQRWRASPGAGGIPVHVHHRTEEAWYVIDGEVVIWLDDQPFRYGQGAYVSVAPGQPHTSWNPADAAAT